MKAIAMTLCLLVAAGMSNWMGARALTLSAADLPFVLPWDDATGGPVNVSFLLEAPAGKSGFVRAEGGHFYVGDKRIKFWGTNVCFGACFPAPEDAPKIAARLAKFGINCVRFHHMDSSPFPRGIFKTWRCEKLSPEAMARLDGFIVELKKRGIYVNLNLHVSRTWSQRHKWENADQLEKYDKMVDIFYPPLLDVQKQFARDLLTHRNPHTGLTYANDPAVAMVEITNEDSLFMWSAPRMLPNLPEPYRGCLEGLWCDWLSKKYKTDAALKKAWQKGAQPLGEEKILDGAFQTLRAVKSEERRWLLEQHEGAAMNATVNGGTVTLNVEKVSGTSWHLQFKQEKLALKKGGFYTVRFRARADASKKVSAGVSQAHSPWGNLGLSSTVTVEKDWQTFVLGFVAGHDEGNARLSFSLGEDRTQVSFAGISLKPGGQLGLGDDESLKEKRVALYPSAFSITEARLKDRFHFYHDLEERYFTGMSDFLKKQLGVKAPITGTIGFGALGTRVQAKLDFVDQHAYWQHPHFPRRPWDSRDWIVRNKPMSADPGGGTFPGLAQTRVHGKPYTVTEYNHPAPMDSQAEMVPMIAGFAALQDWDGVFLFTYNHSSDYHRDRYHGFFDIDANPAKMGFVPAGALIFMGGALTPLQAARVEHLGFVQALEASLLHLRSLDPYLKNRGVDWRTYLDNRWYLSFDIPPKQTGAVHVSQPPPKVIWAPEKKKYFAVDGHGAKILCGRLAGSPVMLGDVTVQVESPRSASWVMVSRDGQALAQSQDILITACGRCENTGMGWNAERTSVSNQWGSTPVRIEPVKGTVRLRTKRAGLKVHALDARGQAVKEVPAEYGDGWLQFSLGGGGNEPGAGVSLWYSIR